MGVLLRLFFNKEGEPLATKKNENNDQLNKKMCLKCQTNKSLIDFYISYSELHADKKVPVCKSCLAEMFDINDPQDSLKEILRQIDKPFLFDLFEASAVENPENVFGKYMKNIGMKQYKGLTWKDSSFNNINKVTESIAQVDNGSISEKLIIKWGDGYNSIEYNSFERKYNMLKNNYQEKTAMHTEALLTYIRYRVKEELATAKGDSKAAKEWGTLAKDAATAAKINPSQLSQSDLSDGLDNFGQLVRSVEQAVDIIPILPKFKERPNDKVDFTIWCYVNYIRDLKGLPMAEYEDIYSFYEQRRKEYEQGSDLSDEE